MPEKAEEPEKRIRASIPIAETDSRKGDKKIIAELREQWMAKKLSFGDYIEGVKNAGGDVIFGNIDITVPEGEQIIIERLMAAYQKGEITIHEMRRCVEEVGGEASFWDWEFDANPNYKPEDSKIGFMWNPYHNKKGIFMQNVTKRVIIKMCDFIYKSILKYDKDSFIFSDSRLIYLREYTKKHLINNVKADYKRDLITKAVDVLLFVMKEDVYYRALLLRMINEAPHNFVISEEEMEYFNRGVPKE